MLVSGKLRTVTRNSVNLAAAISPKVSGGSLPGGRSATGFERRPYPHSRFALLTGPARSSIDDPLQCANVSAHEVG